MSSPASRCSSVAICSKTVETVTLLQMGVRMADFLVHFSVAPRSGIRITSRPRSTCMVSSLKHPSLPPVASQRKSGMKWDAIRQVFSLSTNMTVAEDVASSCSPNRHCFRWKSGSFSSECTQQTCGIGSLIRCPSLGLYPISFPERTLLSLSICQKTVAPPHFLEVPTL